MIIPVKCFTCGTVLGDKYRYFCIEVRQRKLAKKIEADKILYLTNEFNEKTPAGEVLDELNLFKQCCRVCMLTHVDIN